MTADGKLASEVWKSAAAAALAVLALAEGARARERRWEGKWQEAETNGVVPFVVEYRPAHPFLAEYHRRVAFASGKRVGIASDSGGYAELAVYALEDGTYAMTDDDGDRLFRVDTAAETVDMGTGRRWFRLPDETAKIGSWGGRCVTVELENGERQTIKDGMPFMGALNGRRLLGKFVPCGKFAAEAEDKLGWLDEVSWKPCPGWPEEVPFSLEWEPFGTGWHLRKDWRVVFPSGTATGIWATYKDETSFSLHGMPDGNYALTEEGPVFSTVYRICPETERMDCQINGAWVEMPGSIREIWGTSWSNDGTERWIGGVDEDGNVVEGTNSVPVGATMEGKRLLGRVTKDGTFERAGEGIADAGVEGEGK